MSYHIGLLMIYVCKDGWALVIGIGVTSYCVVLVQVYLFISKEFRQRHTKYWNGTLVYYLSVSGTGNLSDANDSYRKQSSVLYFIQVHPTLGA